MNDQNRRLLLTVALCMVVAVIWSFFFQPKPRPAGTPPPPAPAATQPEQKAAPAPPAAENVPRETKAPPAAQGPRPPTQKVVLQSDKLRVVLSSDGAVMESAQLLGAKFQKRVKGDGEVPVELVRTKPGEPFPLATTVRAGASGEVVPLLAPYEVVRKDDRSAVLRSSAGGVTVTKTFSVDPKTYRLDLAVEMRAANPVAGRLGVLSTGEGESGSGGGWFSSHTNAPARAICQAGGKLERVGVGQKTPTWDGPGPASFAGIDEQYFIGAVVPPANSGATCHLEARPEGPLISTIEVPVDLGPGKSFNQTFIVYVGPKDTDELAAVATPLKESVDLGFWAVIASVLLAVMKFFHSAVPPHNWGIAIILLTLTVKVLTFPLQHKSMKSMQEMQRLQPQIEDIKKKYAGDQQRQNQEQMKLFKEHGVNPMGSCLPMLIQMPVWLALYTALQVSVELYNSVFIPGWLEDLTAKDPYYVLPVAMGITMLATQMLTPTPMSQPGQKTMGYAMSLFFSVLMLNLPSGLTLYIFVNNILSIIQQIYLRRSMRPPRTPGESAGPPGRSKEPSRAGRQTVDVSPRRA
ncbi:MAG: membrane protein insertase YidC [Myxococcales bacterium]